MFPFHYTVFMSVWRLLIEASKIWLVRSIKHCKTMSSGVFRGGGLAPAPPLSADHNFL